MIVWQLIYFSVWEKDYGCRCDFEVGMVKFLGVWVVWLVVDNVLQIYGGNGFVLEYIISWVLCDVCIFNIFEGVVEIQVQVIVCRLLG